MQSTLKQHLNCLSDNQQTSNPTLSHQNNSINTKQQTQSSSNNFPSSMNEQNPPPSNSQLPRSLFLHQNKPPSSLTEEANPKPTNDRQSESFIPQSDQRNSYLPKNIIEIIDDDDLEEHKTGTVEGHLGVVDKQNFKNKQISNPLLSSSTSVLNPQIVHNIHKVNELNINETSVPKSVTQNSKLISNLNLKVIQTPNPKVVESLSDKLTQSLSGKLRQNPKPAKPIQNQKPTQNSKQKQSFQKPQQSYHKAPQHSKPQGWSHTYPLPQTKPFQKQNQLPSQKHPQPTGKSMFTSSIPQQQFYQFINSRNPLYDTIYQRDIMGLGFPHSMINYPIMTDSFYWPNNPLDRFGMPQQNPSSPYNYLFPQPDPLIIGKNISLLNHSPPPLSGFKTFGQNSPLNPSPNLNHVINSNKHYGLSQSFIKDDKFFPQTHKHFFNNNITNTTNKNPNHQNSIQEQKRKQPQNNYLYYVSKDAQKKDVSNVGGEKKKQPQVIQLLDSDDDVITEINKKSKSLPDKPSTNDHRKISSNTQLSYPNKQQPYNFNYPSQFQKPTAFKPVQQPQNLIKQSSYPRGKIYKQPIADSYLQKTKLIQKQPRQENTKGKGFTDNRNELTLQRVENLEILQKIIEHRQIQQRDLSDLFTNPSNDPAVFYQNTKNMFQTNYLQQNPFYQKHGNFQFPQQTMKQESYTHEKIMDLKKSLKLLNPQDVEHLRYLEQYNDKKINQNRHVIGQMLKATTAKRQSGGYETSKIQKPTNSNPKYTISIKQISGLQHVKRQVQKAIQKKQNRTINKNKHLTSHNSSLNKDGKTILKYEGMQEMVEQYKKVHDSNYKKGKLSGNANKDTIHGNNKIECENQEKEAGWVFEWTPKLKRLRDLSKKREYDSVILIGPEFQADIPKFITDQRELKTWKMVKRKNLLQRLYKHCAQI